MSCVQQCMPRNDEISTWTVVFVDLATKQTYTVVRGSLHLARVILGLHLITVARTF